MRKFLQKALAAILLLNAILVTPVFAEGNPVITIIPAEVQAALTDNLSASPQLWKNDAGDITLTLMRYAASDASKDPAESGEEFSIEFPVNIETAGQYELSLIASRTDVNTYSHYAISVDGGEALDVKSPNVSEAQPYADSTIANAKYALRKYSMLNLYNLDAGAHTVKITATTRGTSRVDIYLENIALAYKGGLPDYSQITVDGRTGYTDEGNLSVSSETWDNGIMSCGKLRKGDADVATGEWFAAYSFNCEIPGNYALYMSANRWDINTYSHYAIAVDDKENYIPINNNTAKNITIPDAAKYGGTANYALRNYDVKKNGEDLYIVQNGDSISVGNNMSGCKNIAPYLPIWGELFAEQLRSNYDSNITFNNTSVGGMTSVWGLEHVDKNIAKLSPDLVIIGFGMNDASGNMSKETFKSNVSGMIDKVRAQNPDAEFILVSSIVGNPAAGNVGMTIPQLREGIYELAQEYTGVAVADMTSIHSQLLEKKKYLDMTGNNINHINDYLGRWYAQILSALLIEG